MLRDVLPSRARYDSANVRSVGAVLQSDASSGDAVSAKATNSHDIGIRQLRCWMLLAGQFTASAFHVHVLLVLCVRALNQMFWVDAHRSVARVHGYVAATDRATKLLLENQSATDLVPGAIEDERVSVAVRATSPVEASIRALRRAACDIGPQVLAWLADASHGDPSSLARRHVTGRAHSTRQMRSIRMASRSTHVHPFYQMNQGSMGFLGGLL